LLRTNLLGIPQLKALEVDQRVVRMHHAEHMGARVFPGLLHELLEPSQVGLDIEPTIVFFELFLDIGIILFIIISCIV
jgi:hypothetical protein